MEGLSKREIKVISDLEFQKKHYFTRDDIRNHFTDDRQLTNMIYNLRKKKRIIKINRSKYYLIPIKARTGRWVDDSFIAADEILNGKDYFIGGWAAAHYWKLTDQVPFQVDIWTTRRFGKFELHNTRYIFHKTTQKRLEKAVTVKIDDHDVKILNKKDVRKWLKSRQ